MASRDQRLHTVTTKKTYILQTLGEEILSILHEQKRQIMVLLKFQNECCYGLDAAPIYLYLLF